MCTPQATSHNFSNHHLHPHPNCCLRQVAPTTPDSDDGTCGDRPRATDRGGGRGACRHNSSPQLGGLQGPLALSDSISQAGCLLHQYDPSCESRSEEGKILGPRAVSWLQNPALRAPCLLVAGRLAQLRRPAGCCSDRRNHYRARTCIRGA